MFDKVQNQYVPTVTGLGMHVEVRDPENKMVMSRVRLSITERQDMAPLDSPNH